MSDPVPAVAEAAATGATAEIFADIRRVLGVEVVNLIWRHLATLPDALPWRGGRCDHFTPTARFRMRPMRCAASWRSHIYRLSRPHSWLLAAADIADRDLFVIRNILAAYDRTNAMALVAFSALLYRLDARLCPSGEAALDGGERRPEALLDIPLQALPTLSEMAQPTADLVLILNRLGARRENPVLASMYCHLAYWPAYLALSWALIASLDADGALGRAIADVLVKARSRAAGLAARLDAPPVDRTTNAALCAAVEPFADDVIAKWSLYVAFLRAATGP
jgi:hypothetical protein